MDAMAIGLAPLPLPADARDPWRPFLRTMGWIGLNSFGGPVGQLGVMHDEAVTKHRWVSDEQFLHLVNFASVLPGPEALQVAIHLGYLRRGILGGIAAGLLFVLPGFISLTLLAWLYTLYGQQPWVASVLDGVRPVAVALIAAAAIRISSKVMKSAVAGLIALAAFVGNAFLGVPFLVLLGGCGLLGVVLRKAKQRSAPRAASLVSVAIAGLVVAHVWGHWESGRQIARTAPVTAGERRTGVVDIAWVNTKAALVTFGGAYALLPYLREQTVDRYHWVNDQQVVDGLAFGETTPGPLVSVGIFLSFLAGSWLGATVGCFFLFLPSFVLVLVLARYIDKVEQLPHASDFLWGVSAATLGLIVALSANIAPPMLQSLFGLAVALVTFFAVWRFKVSALLAVGGGALLGLARLAF